MNKNTISKWFSMFVLMMVAGITGATAQSLTVADFSIEQGQSKEVAINVAAAAEQTIYGIQTDITLSEGLTLESVVAADANLQFEKNTLTGGATRVALLSLAGSSIPEGAAIKLTVKASDTFEAGTIKLENSKLTTSAAGAETDVESSTANVTKTSAPQPIPVTATFNFTDPNFREKIGTAAADVDGFIYNETFTADGASLQVIAGSSPSRLYVDADRGQNLVFYSQYGALTFKAPEGKAITKIEFTAAGNSNINKLTASSGAIEGMVWTGNADGVRFTQGASSYLANAVLTMIDKTAETSVLPAIEYTECANIAAFNALAAGTYAKVTLTDAEIIGKSADGYSTVWMQDATGGCWIQYTSLNDKLAEKTKVNGTIYTIKRETSGNPQMKEAEATLQSELNATAIESYTAVAGTITEVNVAANLNKVVKIAADSLVMTSASAQAQAGTLYVGETSITVNNGTATANQLLCKIADWEKDKVLKNITIEAILVAKSATANQLLPISVEETVVPEPEPAPVTGNIAKKAEMTGEITSLEALQSARFMLQNADGLVLYTPVNWDVKVTDLITAVSNKENGGFFEVTALDGDHAGQYLIPIYNINGSRRTYWDGEQYLNSQPAGVNDVIFGLSGSAPNYGQDGPNLALWTIAYEEGQGFAFHCVGRDIYLGNDNEAARPVQTATYWKAYTGYIAGYDEAEILAAYKSATAEIKTTDAAAALAAAKNTYDSDKDLNKFGDAVNAAISDILACKALNEAYANLDATGAAVAAEVLAKYNNGEYANIAALRAAYILAAKAQTTAGADMTLALVNPSFEFGNIDGWTSTDGGNSANNGNFAKATGKFFVEKWTAAPGKLSNGALTQVVTGLPAGKYKLTAEMQNLEQGNNSANGTGYLLVANTDSTAVAVAGETVVVETALAEGADLTIGAVMKDCSGNWVCVDNFQLTYVSAFATETELAELTAEIAIAKTLGVDVDAYENGAFTADEVPAAVEALKVAEYNQVNKDYTLNAAVLVPDFSQWTGDMVSNKGQHWDGTATSVYYEQTGAQWSQSSWTNNKTTTVKLPKGKYVLYAAGRASAGTACTAYIKVNDVTRTYTSKGDVGFGVATDGTASFDPNASYANGGKGRGFEYRYVAFEVTAEEGQDIALEVGGEATAEHQWMSFTAPVLLTTEDNAAIILPVLNSMITAASADLETLKGAVGEGLFQKPQAAYDEYAAAVAAADSLAKTENPTVEAINAAIAEIDAKAAAFANAPVNAPDTDKEYVITNKTAELALSIGNEAVKIEKEGIVKFTKVEGGWILSNNAETPEYIFKTTANTWTFSTTTNKDEAYVVNFNIADGAYTIQGANGLFGTDNTAEGSAVYANKAQKNNGLWLIAEYEEKLEEKTYEGYVAIVTTEQGAAITPVTTAPQTVTITETETDNLFKVGFSGFSATAPAVTFPAFTFDANVDANEDFTTEIYESVEGSTVSFESGMSFTFNLKAEGTNTIGDAAPVFHLQLNQSPTMIINVVFAATEDDAKAALDVTTGITSVKANADNKAIFNLNGQKVNKAQKGLYIINGKKVVIK